MRATRKIDFSDRLRYWEEQDIPRLAKVVRRGRGLGDDSSVARISNFPNVVVVPYSHLSIQPRKVQLETAPVSAEELREFVNLSDYSS